MSAGTRSLARLLTVVAAVAGVGVVAGPAVAVEGTTYWSVSANTGWANGSLYASGSANRWSLSGTARDDRSGDNCTRTIVYEVSTLNERRVRADLTICNGGSQSFSASGTIFRSFAPDSKAVEVSVCEKRGTAYICSTKSMRVQ